MGKRAARRHKPSVLSGHHALHDSFPLLFFAHKNGHEHHQLRFDPPQIQLFEWLEERPYLWSGEDTEVWKVSETTREHLQTRERCCLTYSTPLTKDIPNLSFLHTPLLPYEQCRQVLPFSPTSWCHLRRINPLCNPHSHLPYWVHSATESSCFS